MSVLSEKYLFFEKVFIPVVLKEFLSGAGYYNKIGMLTPPQILNGSQFAYHGGNWAIVLLYGSLFPLRYYFKTKNIKKPYIFFNTVLNSLNLSLLLSSITETEIFPQTMLARFLFLGLTFSALLPLTYSQTIKQFRSSTMMVAVHNQTQSALSTVKNAIKNHTDDILRLTFAAGATSTITSVAWGYANFQSSFLHLVTLGSVLIQLMLLLASKTNKKYEKWDSRFLYLLTAGKHTVLQSILTTNIVGNFVYGRPGEPNFGPYTDTAFFCVLGLINLVCGLLFAAHDIHVMEEDRKRRQAASQSSIIELEEIKPDTTPDSPQEGKKRLSDELSEQGTLSRSRTPSPVKGSPLQSPLLPPEEQWTEISFPPSPPQLAIVAPVEPSPSVLSPQSPGFFARARAWVLGAPAQTPKDVELAVRARP